MKKIYKLFAIVIASAAAFSCAESLEVKNPSVVDGDFVFSSIETAQTVILGAYNSYVGIVNSGYPTNFEDIGSDVERCSAKITAAPLCGAAMLYGGSTSYVPEEFQINTYKYWDTFYSIITKCNQIIYQVEKKEGYDQNVPNDWSDLLGQAYALRATMYYDLTRLFGDVIYIDEAYKTSDVMSPRDSIIECEIACLEKIEGYMYKLGQNSHYPDRMTRNYVDGLIGRLCFAEAGYSTRRTDLGSDFYKDAEGNVISFDVWGTDASRNAVYERRSDWKKFYTRALPYLQKAVNDPGEAELIVTDPRGDKTSRVYGNPFQYYFEQVTKEVMPMESVYEVTMKQENGGSRIAYNFGRGSNGGSPACPPKANAQTCSYPRVFYNEFDPMDMRRDVSVNVTGNTGGGVEAIYDYGVSNKNSIGIGMNKYDVNRQDYPDLRQLYSGINYVLMRQSDIILMLAEAYAQTGDEGMARTELKKVHDRAFPDDVQDAKFAELISDAGSVLEAIYKERQLEFVGENIRRQDLVRTGKLPQVAVEYRKALEDEIKEMKANGYVQYENGNQFPAYIWTKLINARQVLGYRLTAQTPENIAKLYDDTSDMYGLLVPGWRGQHDDWLDAATSYGNTTKLDAGYLDGTTYGTVKSNLSIIGLFRYIDPEGAEAKALEARGYVKTGWGIETYAERSGNVYKESASREAEWSSNFMCGYTDADYAAKKAPIHLIPMQATVCATTGLKNGYGFKSE